MSHLSSLHPAVLALYFVSVLAVTMFSSNPVFTAFALLSGIVCVFQQRKKLPTAKEAGYGLLLFILISVTNPLFSHNGVTVLFFMNGNPVTLESLLYGLYLAGTMLAVLAWFQSVNLVMTTDQHLFLWGRISPKLALLLSFALRFVPLLRSQGERIRAAQKTMGLSATDAWTDKLRGAARVYSALITWSLEYAVDMGASMKARGYGLKPRSRYALYAFRKRDAFVLILIAVLDSVVFWALSTERLNFSFYPALSYGRIGFDTILATGCFFALCLLPIVIETKEDLLWRYYRSKI